VFFFSCSDSCVDQVLRVKDSNNVFQRRRT
jgi:hypothetical protein